MLNPKEFTVSSYLFDNVTVDLESFIIRKDSESRSLTPRAFDVLVFLIEQRGRVVEKREIFQQIWNETFVTDNALSRSINEIRRTLGDDPKEAKYIETVHKRGYRFIAEVEVRLHTEPISSREGAKDKLEDEPKIGSKVVQLVPTSPDLPLNLDQGVPAGRRLISIKTATISAAFFFALVTVVFWTIYLKPSTTETARPLKITQITSWAGLDVNPSLSPDGSAIAYSSNYNGSFEIYVKPLGSGGREIQITSNGEQNFDPAWSPDGKLIAYYSMKRGGIWLVPPFGGPGKQLTNFGSHPCWSPDGKSIAFHSVASPDLGAMPAGASSIWTIEVQGGTPSQITRAGSPAGAHVSPTWSPDGKRIAFINVNLTSTDIWSISADGNEPRVLTKPFAEEGFRPVFTPEKIAPVYAPDGKSIYFTTGNTVWKQPILSESRETGEAPSKIVDMGDALVRHLTISANGKNLAYSAWTRTSNLYSLPMSPETNEPAGTPVPLTKQRALNFRDLTFSPDGRRVAFSVEQRGLGEGIWLMNADGSSPRQLTTDIAPNHQPNRMPNWFPEGNRIGFISRRQGLRKLWSITLDGGGEVRIADISDDMTVPRVSPDGKQIAFNFTKDGVVNIGTRSIAGGEPKQITFEKEFAGFPCWSSDGQFLAFQTKRGDHTQVAFVRSDGGEPTQLTFDHGQSWPNTWSPDAGKIAFAGARNGIWNIWWVSRADKSERQLTQYSNLNAYVRRPAWSPLGTQIVYEYVETTGNIFMVDLN